jgi:homoserine dehydrogenase
VTGFDGILNSTTNIILTEMEAKQCSFEAALQAAQEAGIAECDPSDDAGRRPKRRCRHRGHDAAIKLALLWTVLLNEPLPLSAIATGGIGSSGSTRQRKRGCASS